MARVAQDIGNGAMLYPADIHSALDAPADLVLAIEHSQSIIGWQRNLPSDDMPPRWMWPFVDHLNDWFEVLAIKRDEESGKDAPDDDHTMMSNSLAKDGIRQSV
jgi:hypothetical protein